MNRIDPRVESLEGRVLLALYGPDPSFATGGIADVEANILIDILPNDEILTVGTQHIPGEGNDDPGYDLSYARRLNPDGTLDSAFGDNGSVFLGEGYADSLVVGSSLYVLEPAYSNDEDITTLQRYSIDGQLDSNYQPGGDSSESFRRLADAPDGGFFIIGLDVVKYKPDGSIDTSFGNAGTLALPATNVGNEYRVNTTPTIHGVVDVINIGNTFEITRYKTDGSGVDTTFGAAGKVTTSENNFSFLTEQSDGKLIMVAAPYAEPGPIARIRRLNIDGSLDTSYGNSGVAELPQSEQYESIIRARLDPQDRLLLSSSRSLYRVTSAGEIEGDPFNGFLRPFEVSFGAAQIEFDGQGRILTGSSSNVTRLDDLQPTQIGRDGVLYVNGDDADDTVTIAAGSNNQINVTRNGQLTQYDADDIAGINLRLHEGKHTVNVSFERPTTVTTGAGNDSITTSDADDSIAGGTGDNTIVCGDGNDSIELSEYDHADHQHVTGGNGNKTITIGSGRLTANLGVGDSKITSSYGGGHNEITIAGGNNNVALSGESDVLTIGGNGDNTVTVSAPGVSTITTGAGNDSISISSAGTFTSGAGNDTISVSATAAHGAPPGSGFYGTVTVFCGDGDDRVTTYNGYETDPVVFGGNGNDTMIGGLGTQTFYGNAGKDILRGGDSSDLLSGGGGHDRLFGDAGKDRLYGGDGWDTLDGGTGDDRLFGHNDPDHLLGNAGNDTLSGGASNDWLYGNTGDDLLNGDGGNDRLYSDDDNGGIDTLHGGAGDDYLVAQDGVAEQLFGDRGTDSFLADSTDARTGLEIEVPAPPPRDFRFQNFAPMGPERTLANNLVHFDTATAANGNFIIAAATAGPTNGSFNITATRFDSAGQQLGDTLTLDSPDFGEGSSILGVSVSMDADGDAVVLYCVGDPPYNWTSKLYFVRISRDGAVSAPILAGEGGLSDPAVSMDASGGFFIGWIEGAFNNQGPTAVRMRAYDAAGAPRGDVFNVADDNDDFLSYEIYALEDLDIVAKPDGSGALFTFGETSGGYTVIHVRFGQASTTARIGPLRSADANANEISNNPALALYPDGSFLIGFGRDGFFVQHYDRNGDPFGALIPIAESPQAVSLQSLRLDDLPDGGFIASYIQGSSEGNVVYARRDDRYKLSDPVEIARLTDIINEVRFAVDVSGTGLFAYDAAPDYSSPHTLHFRRASAELAAVDQNKLYVFGSPDHDAITIKDQDDKVIVTRNGKSVGFAAAGIAAISPVGLTSDDSFDNGTSLSVS